MQDNGYRKSYFEGYLSAYNDLITKKINRKKVSKFITEMKEWSGVEFDVSRLNRIKEMQIPSIERSKSYREVDLKPGFVYFVRKRGTDEIQIGHTVNIKSRMQSIKTGVTGELELIFKETWEYSNSKSGSYWAKYSEKNYHSLFSSYRIKREWFLLPNIDNYISGSLFNKKEYVSSLQSNDPRS